MTFRRFFALIAIAVYSAAFFMAGMMVVNLYALYVLIYTGAVFMVGVYLGEKFEYRLSTRATAEAERELKPITKGFSERVEWAAKGR